jgi:hypothetical protein
MNFKYFKKYIHNGSGIVHKSVRSSMVKSIFELDVSLRNYREKIEEIRIGARMQYVSACVSPRQLLGVTPDCREVFMP